MGRTFMLMLYEKMSITPTVVNHWYLMTDGIKIVTLNTRGLRKTTKMKEVLIWLQLKEPKVIFLHETHTTSESEHAWRQEWPGLLFFSHATHNSKGTCIHIHKSVPLRLHNSIIDADGRYVILDAEMNGLRLTLCNVYGPNDDNTDFYVEVIQHVEAQPNHNRIIGGDFNLILNSEIDRKSNATTTNKKSQILINNWMEETELTDIWRFQHPDSRKYTWYRKNPQPVFCRLDFFLISYGITKNITKSDIHPGYKSDHSLISIIFKPFLNPSGRGFWKLNCSHLKDIEYINRVKLTIQNVCETNRDANPNIQWDVIKTAVRGESIKYGAQKKKLIDNEMMIVEGKMKDLEENLQDNDDNRKWDQLHSYKEKN